jgi:hypothetical protein
VERFVYNEIVCFLYDPRSGDVTEVKTRWLVATGFLFPTLIAKLKTKLITEYRQLRTIQ